MIIDGSLDEWTAADRLDYPGTGDPGYEIYGRVVDGKFVFAVRSTAAAIGAGTTFWLNTDRDTTTGYQIFGSTGGAEYNINFFTDNQPYLYSGGAGENFLAGPIEHAYGADQLTVEFAVPFDLIGETDAATDLLVDINNTAFLPTSYAAGSYTLAVPTPPSTVGSVLLDGSLTDWTAADRLDRPGTGTAGYEIYGRLEGGHYIVAIKAAVAIGPNTTAWLNTDRNPATGYQIFGATGGAEYNVNFGPNLVPSLYSGAAGGTLEMQSLLHGFSSDRQIVEFAIPTSALSGNPSAVDMLFDINDQVFAPSNFGAYAYTVKDTSTLPVRTDLSLKVGIVFSETTANNFFAEMAYSHLFMTAQSQATMAGIPFDLLTESDLTDLAKLANYDTLIFPSFRNVPLDKLSAIQDALSDAVYHYGIGLITAGDFMTNDQFGAALPGDPYIRMKTLLNLEREGGASGANVDVIAGDIAHPAMEDYASNELIHSYSNFTTSYFGALEAGANVLATQVVNGETHDAVIATQTGGRNVHFATEGMLGDNNMLAHALDWTAEPAPGPSLNLLMSRQSGLFASRNDMDQSQELSDVDPETGAGIYDLLVPILAQWKQNFNFVGSYYINVGNNPAEDQETNWAISKPYYETMLAAGNEIGSHSYTHPHDTNILTPEQFEFEFQQSKQTIEQQLGISILGAAVPGAPETLDTARNIAQYYSYLSGGAALIGAGYPGSFGYLTPGDTGSVYLAPNMSFDFTLIGFQNLTAEQAEAAWAREWSERTSHSDLPIVVWPWHDYGPTRWVTEAGAPVNYTEHMFTSVIERAHAAGSEFVTLADLAQRIASFEEASLNYSYNASANTITATAAAANFGKFAFDVEGTQSIQSVTGWYAYDNDSVFLPSAGGAYTIQLGATADDVTHITSLPSRAELLSLSGDGTGVTFSIFGEGRLTIDLKQPDGMSLEVTGAQIVSLVGDRLELDLGAIGQHNVSVNLVSRPPNTTATGEPAISDTTPTEGQVLTAFPGTIADANGTTGSVFTYQWQQDAGAGFVNIAGAINATFTAVQAQVNNPLRVIATFTDDVGYVETLTSAATIVAGDLLVGTAAADTFNGTAGQDNASGLGGADILNGNAENDILDGGAGNDTLDGGTGADALSGGAGNDTYVVDNVGDAVTENSAGGTDTIRTALASYTLGANVENLIYTGPVGIGFTGIGNTLANAMTGGSGNDTLNGGAGADTLTGGLGDDLYVVERAGDNVIEELNGGIDAVQSSVTYTLTANAENLVLTGTANINGTGNALANQLVGNGGANTLDGLGGNDTMAGGLGNDTYLVDSVGDVVVENSAGGTDTIGTALASYSLVIGNNVENLTFTGSANFQGVGNELVNRITGGIGNDALDGGVDAVNDTLVGGAGNDTYIVRSGDVVSEQANAGRDVVQTDLLTYTLGANVEDLIFTGTGALRGTGNALGNAITGGIGNDILNGAAGADTMNGGDGNDRYTVDNASDVIIDSSGVDLVTISTGLTSYTLQPGLEQLTYSGANGFTATGSDGDNTIATGSGADTLFGGIGADILGAGGGADKLYGGAGNDILEGGAGADRLEGGAGLDTLTGGADADTYLFDAPTGASADQVIGFSRAQGDKVAVYALDYGLAAGALNPDWFETSATSAGTKAHAEFIYNSTTRTLSWDSDGAGSAAAVAIATFSNAANLQSTDFLIL